MEPVDLPGAEEYYVPGLFQDEHYVSPDVLFLPTPREKVPERLVRSNFLAEEKEVWCELVSLFALAIELSRGAAVKSDVVELLMAPVLTAVAICRMPPNVLETHASLLAGK